MSVKQHMIVGIALPLLVMILTAVTLFNYPRPPMPSTFGPDGRPVAAAAAATGLPPLPVVLGALQVLFFAAPILWGKLASARCPQPGCHGRAFQKGFGPSVYECRDCGHQHRTGVSVSTSSTS